MNYKLEQSLNYHPSDSCCLVFPSELSSTHDSSHHWQGHTIINHQYQQLSALSTTIAGSCWFLLFFVGSCWLLLGFCCFLSVTTINPLNSALQQRGENRSLGSHAKAKREHLSDSESTLKMLQLGEYHGLTANCKWINPSQNGIMMVNDGYNPWPLSTVFTCGNLWL